MIVVLVAVLALFTWAQITARAEPPSYNSGTNFAMTATMALVLLILASFATLSVSIDENWLRIKFGYGIFRKKFAVSEIVSVRRVKNPWYCGWGIRLRFWPRIWIFNVSGFDAVEIVMKNPVSARASAGRAKIYRIGTDEPEKLEAAIREAIRL